MPYKAALSTSKSSTIVGYLSPKSTEDFVGERRVTGVPQLGNWVPKVG